jgi:hypothetical protein
MGRGIIKKKTREAFGENISNLMTRINIKNTRLIMGDLLEQNECPSLYA